MSEVLRGDRFVRFLWGCASLPSKRLSVQPEAYLQSRSGFGDALLREVAEPVFPESCLLGVGALEDLLVYRGSIYLGGEKFGRSDFEALEQEDYVSKKGILVLWLFGPKSVADRLVWIWYANLYVRGEDF